jgi:hypothetical protein
LGRPVQLVLLGIIAIGVPHHAAGRRQRQHHDGQQHPRPDSLSPYGLLPVFLRILFFILFWIITHVLMQFFQDVVNGLFQLRLEIRYDVDILPAMLTV